MEEEKLLGISYEQYDKDIAFLVERIKEISQKQGKKYENVYGIPRGGYYPAIEVSNALGLPLVTTPTNGSLVVDDILDSGKTISIYTQDIAVVYIEKHSIKDIQKIFGDRMIYIGKIKDGWIDIPDEKGCGIRDHIRRCLEYIGENPNRPGLLGTPDRIVRMWKEIYRGYDQNQKPKITVFDNGSDGLVYDSMVIDSGDFNSKCEHHARTFWGKYWFAYIPNPKGKILGISKIGRVVDYCGARLQVQERLVHDVVSMLKEALGDDNPPLGMALVMKGHHGCKEFRGVKKKGVMTSSFLDGAFRDDPQVRAEFMQLVNNADYE